MDGRDTKDEEKLDGFNKEEKTSGNLIRHGPKNLEKSNPKSPCDSGWPRKQEAV